MTTCRPRRFAHKLLKAAAAPERGQLSWGTAGFDRYDNRECSQRILRRKKAAQFFPPAVTFLRLSFFGVVRSAGPEAARPRMRIAKWAAKFAKRPQIFRASDQMTASPYVVQFPARGFNVFRLGTRQWNSSNRRTECCKNSNIPIGHLHRSILQ